MRRCALVAVLALVLGGCVTPLDKYLHPTPTGSLYDWRCVVSGPDSPNAKPFVMWLNDKGIHDVAGVLTDPNMKCTWITAAQNCAGAPPEQYVACLHTAKP